MAPKSRPRTKGELKAVVDPPAPPPPPPAAEEKVATKAKPAGGVSTRSGTREAVTEEPPSPTPRPNLNASTDRDFSPKMLRPDPMPTNRLIDSYTSARTYSDRKVEELKQRARKGKGKARTTKKGKKVKVADSKTDEKVTVSTPMEVTDDDSNEGVSSSKAEPEAGPSTPVLQPTLPVPSKVDGKARAKPESVYSEDSEGEEVDVVNISDDNDQESAAKLPKKAEPLKPMEESSPPDTTTNRKGKSKVRVVVEVEAQSDESSEKVKPKRPKKKVKKDDPKEKEGPSSLIKSKPDTVGGKKKKVKPVIEEKPEDANEESEANPKRAKKLAQPGQPQPNTSASNSKAKKGGPKGKYSRLMKEVDQGNLLLERNKYLERLRSKGKEGA